MVRDSRERALRHLSEMIWKKRVKRGYKDANNEVKNWFLAVKLLDKIFKRYNK